MSPKLGLQEPEAPATLVGMEIDQEYAVVGIDDIAPHPKNPNQGDVPFIQESIRVNGWYGAVVCQRRTRGKHRILAGEHRWRAAKKEGATQIAIILRDVDDIEAIRIMLVDNEAARQGSLDPQVKKLLLEKLAKLGDDALDGTGFTLDDLAAEEAAAEKDEVEIGVIEPDDRELETQYGIIVMVKGEEDQRDAYEELSAKYGAENLRVVSV